MRQRSQDFWVILIPEEIQKYHACGGKMNKNHLSTFLIYTIPASGTRTCLQDPILQLEAGGRKGSRAGTIQSWKLPCPCKFMTITFSLRHQSSENTFENSISTSWRIETHKNEFEKGQFLNDFYVWTSVAWFVHK